MEAVARLKNYPTSPRKMRLLADLIRGMEVDKALEVLQYSPKHPAVPLYKLLKSAISNWEQKNSDSRVEDAGLIVKSIMVDGGRVLKRMKPAAQGRGYRIRKRSNHVTLVVGSIQEPEVNFDEVEENEEKIAAGHETKLAEPKQEKIEEVKDEEAVEAKAATVKKTKVKTSAKEDKAVEKKEVKKSDSKKAAKKESGQSAENNKEMDQSTKNETK